MQSATQSSQPQHEPDWQPEHWVPGSVQTTSPPRQSPRHWPVLKLQAWPSGQPSSSSHAPGGAGTQAERQSLHPAQDEVAQGWHTKPAPHASHASMSQAFKHSPVPKMQSSSGAHSSGEVQNSTGPDVAETTDTADAETASGLVTSVVETLEDVVVGAPPPPAVPVLVAAVGEPPSPDPPVP